MCAAAEPPSGHLNSQNHNGIRDLAIEISPVTTPTMLERQKNISGKRPETSLPLESDRAEYIAIPIPSMISSDHYLDLDITFKMTGSHCQHQPDVMESKQGTTPLPPRTPAFPH